MCELIGCVWANQELEQSEKHVLLYLVYRANKEGVCWPSLQTIARDTGFTRVGVQKILKRLRDKGYLTWEPGERSNVYRLNLGRLRAMAKEVVEEGGANQVSPPANLVSPPANLVSPPANLVSPPANPVSTPPLTQLAPPANLVSTNHSKNHPIEPSNEPPTTPPPIVPPHEAHRVEEVEEVEAKKAEEKKASPSPEKPNLGNLKGFLAAALGGVSRTAIAHTPEVPGEMVRLLKERDLWTELARLRRYARDERAWFSWLAGPIARLWQSNPEGFPEALAEALAALARRPEVREPLTYVEAVARKRLTPNGEATRSEEDPAARALRLLREGQEPSDEDLAEAFRRYGVPTKAGVGRYNGLSSDGEWVYARLGGDIIAVSRREAIRRLMDAREEVAHAG